MLGSVLLRTRDGAVWGRFNSALGDGRRLPHREVLDGVLVIFGGAFLITPGFLTDIVGLLLLIPPTRAVVRGIVLRRLGRRVVVGVTGDRAACATALRRGRDRHRATSAPSRRLDR